MHHHVQAARVEQLITETTVVHAFEDQAVCLHRKALTSWVTQCAEQQLNAFYMQERQMCE